MAALDFEAPVKTKTEESPKTSLVKGQTYTTVLGTIKDGKLVFPHDIQFPDGTAVLITILQEEPTAEGNLENERETSDLENMSLGEHLIAAYQDMTAGRYTSVKTAEELTQYLEGLAGED